MEESTEERPPIRVTIGVPVYNGSDTIEETIRSAMAQPEVDLEILVVDNASTDHTGEICLRLAAEDPRVRYVRNQKNVGQNGNFTRVFELARGEWLRWLGASDTIAPDYVASCLQVAEDRPEASVVTTLIDYVLEDGTVRCEPYVGQRPTQTDPVQRLDTMLALLTGNPFWIDPIYSLIRRQALADSRLISPLRYSDEVVACDLALWGPFIHVDRALATRAWSAPPQRTKALRSASGVGDDHLRDVVAAAFQRPLMLKQVYQSMARVPHQTASDRARGLVVLSKYLGRLGRRRVRGRLARMRARPEVSIES